MKNSLKLLTILTLSTSLFADEVKQGQQRKSSVLREELKKIKKLVDNGLADFKNQKYYKWSNVLKTSPNFLEECEAPDHINDLDISQKDKQLLMQYHKNRKKLRNMHTNLSMVLREFDQSKCPDKGFLRTMYDLLTTSHSHTITIDLSLNAPMDPELIHHSACSLLKEAILELEERMESLSKKLEQELKQEKK